MLGEGVLDLSLSWDESTSNMIPWQIKNAFTFVWMCFFTIGIWTFSYKNWIIAREMHFYLFRQGYLSKESGCRMSEATYKVINFIAFAYIIVVELLYLVLCVSMMDDDFIP